MHILLIHQAFATLSEAGGTRHHELALFLSENGCQVTIIASPISYLTGGFSDTKETDGDHPGIKIIRPPVYNALHKSFLHRVLNFISFMVSSFWVGLRVKNVDLVWGTSPPIFQGLTAWALARLKRVPFLFEVRDLWPAFAVAVGVLRSKVLILASECLERFLYRSADCLLVNSPGFMVHVQERGARDIRLVPNGTDVSMFDTDDNGGQFRKFQGLEEKFIALYAGAHGMSNDLGVVLSAADKLRDLPDLAIILLGDGKEKANLQAEAARMDLENIYFIPSIAKSEMSNALAAADICIAILKPVELYKTVYPNKVFDYMAAGRPVVLAIDGVIREVVERAQAGTAVPPGNPQALAETIRMYYADPDLGRLQGLNGRNHVITKFNRPKLAQNLLEIILSMTDKDEV